MLIGDLSALVHTLVVGVVAYASLVVLLRISGKRTLSKWNAFDFIVTVAFGSVLATSFLSRDVSVAQSALAFGSLVGLQFAVTWTSVRFRAMERLVKSSPTLLVYRGKLQHDTLRRERVTEVEVRSALRAHGVANLEDVGALVLETDGSFSLLEELGPDAFALGDIDRSSPDGAHPSDGSTSVDAAV